MYDLDDNAIYIIFYIPPLTTSCDQQPAEAPASMVKKHKVCQTIFLFFIIYLFIFGGCIFLFVVRSLYAFLLAVVL